jgi:hypothetical protein
VLKSESVLQDFVKKQALYCVWIRANQTPGAPLVSVWVDSEMRAFEVPGEAAEWTLTADAGPAEGTRENRPSSLTADDVKHSV